MMMLTRPEGKPTLDEAAVILKIDRERLDQDFGVRLIDPKTKQYAVRAQVDDDATPKGAFSDPRIGPFK
jgi:hypothetical protein